MSNKEEKMKTSSIPKVGVVFLVLAVVLLAACATPEPAPTPPPTTPGIQTVTVTIGGLLDHSGPTASGTLPGINAMHDYIDYVNSQGGFDWSGGKLIIEMDLPDCRYDPAISFPAYDKMVAKGYPIIMTHASFDNIGLKDKAAKDKVVLATISATSGALAEPGWVFAPMPAYASNFCGFLDWAKETWEGPEPPKIGTLTWDNPWGKAHLCALDYVEKIGLEYVGTEYCATAPSDVTPQLARLAEGGCDYVWTQSTAPVPTIMKDMYRTDFPGVLVASSNTPVDDYLPVVGFEVAAGTLHACPTIDWMAEPDSEAVRFFQMVQLERLGQLRPPATFYLNGALDAMLSQWAITTALDQGADPNNVTGQDCYDALLTAKDVDFMGITMPVTFTPEMRQGGMGVKMYEAQANGTMKTVSEWRICPDALKMYPDCAK